MKTISLDLRERILAAYDAGDATRDAVGRRFRVSEGMVKKLLQQRRRTGEIGPRHYRSGRKRRIGADHRQRLREAVAQKPDATLAELRAALDLNCTLPAIHYVLGALGLTYKKRHSMRPSKTGPTSHGRADAGVASKADSIPRSSFSSMSRRRKRT
jgi:transposase